MQGARSAEAGMYLVVHEDFEYCATQQTPFAAFFVPYTENELPQPQVDVALGLVMTKREPSSPS